MKLIIIIGILLVSFNSFAASRSFRVKVRNMKSKQEKTYIFSLQDAIKKTLLDIPNSKWDCFISYYDNGAYLNCDNSKDLAVGTGFADDKSNFTAAALTLYEGENVNSISASYYITIAGEK